MVEAMAAARVAAMKGPVARSICSRVEDMATRLGSTEAMTGPREATNCAGSERVRMRIGYCCE